MKKLFLISLCLLLSSIQTFANPIEDYVKKYNLGKKSKNGIFIKDYQNNEIIFERNADVPFNPASTLKALMLGASNQVLGRDYIFETSLYKLNNDLYLKLGADVAFTSNDLKKIFAQYKQQFPNSKIDKIFIDSTILNDEPYPQTWLEGDIWPTQRTVTPFIIDRNYHTISLNRSSLAKKVDIIQEDVYKLPIINELKIGDKTSYTIERLYGNDSSIINLKGEISDDVSLRLPVLNPEINFCVKLKKALEDNKIIYTTTFEKKSLPKEAIKITSITHSLEEISKRVLAISDNLAPEIIARVAAAKHINYEHGVTFEDVQNMFFDVYKNQMTDDIKIADCSGVSRQNYITCKFITSCLLYLYENIDFKELLATPGSGTLSNRLLFLKDNLNAKTGTLRCSSALLGTLKTKQNRDVIFCIITQDSPKRKPLLKNFENVLVGLIYRKF